MNCATVTAMLLARLHSKVQLQLCARYSNTHQKDGRTWRLYYVIFGVTTGGLAFASWKQKHSYRSRETALKLEETWKDRFLQNRNKYLSDYKGYVMPFFYMNEKDFLNNCPVQTEDIFVSSFPKSGTTWLQEIVYLLLNGPESRTSETIESRFPYFEYFYPGPRDIMKRKAPRLLKTHLPYSLLPKQLLQNKAKVIYIARNPKDVSVSYWFFHKMIKEVDFKGNFEEFFSMVFKQQNYAYGPWWKHVAEYWLHRNDDSILFITYEQLTQDPAETIKKIAAFLSVEITDEGIAKIVSRCSFQSMKNNDTTNYSWWYDLGVANKEIPFMRRGKVGDWKRYYTPAMNDWVENMVQETLSPLGLKFVYSLDNNEDKTTDNT